MAFPAIPSVAELGQGHPNLNLNGHNVMKNNHESLHPWNVTHTHTLGDHGSSSLSSCSTLSSGSIYYFSSISKLTGRAVANVLDNCDNEGQDQPETPVVNSIHLRLEKEIEQCQHSNIQLLDFVQHVWGLDKAVGRKVLSQHISSDVLTKAYKGGSGYGKAQGDFVALADALLQAVLVELGDQGELIANAFWDANTSRNRDGDDDGNRVIFNLWKSTQSQETGPGWGVAKHIIEIKPDPCITYRSESVTRTTAQTVSSRPEPPTDGRGNDSISVLMRSFDSIKDVGDDDGRAPKKARLIDNIPPLKHSHLPLFASRALASTSRHWVTGLTFDGFKVTACYFDRCLVASTIPFFFDENPECLALTTADGASHQPELPVKDVVRSFFEYPASPSSVDCAVSSQPVPPVIFKVCEVIRRPYGLISRGSAVYKVQLLLSNGTLSGEALAYKLTWASKKRPSEIGIVKQLKEKLPSESHVHLPDFIFATSFTAEDLHLPWLGLGLNLTADNHEERVQRGMLGGLYGKLWEAGSIENFKQAWLDCVECHYLALKMGEVLHCDLSETNIMIRIFGDGVVKGVLNDWDMAKIVGDQAQSLSEPDQCAGTFPFMALDLLERETSPHWLRHDLESFFYILLWAAMHYNLAIKTRDEKVHPILEAWTTDLKSNTERKIQIFSTRPIPVQRIYNGVKAEFVDLIQEWIEPLRSLFTSAQDAYYLPRAPADPPIDEETYGGRLTFKAFMAAINVTPRTCGISGFLDGND